MSVPLAHDSKIEKTVQRVIKLVFYAQSTGTVISGWSVQRSGLKNKRGVVSYHGGLSSD